MPLFLILSSQMVKLYQNKKQGGYRVYNYLVNRSIQNT
nr:MAG TPA: hypothetical protein [Caudoviricetes sp.]DAT95434.1 MAG TPA: hypothetical protein [Caudoviricetes sp.]